MFRKLAALALALVVSTQSHAEGDQQRHRIGYGLFFTNDLFGDGKDRWRTGAITSSRIYGADWQGQAPAGFGELLELRIQGQIIAPERLRSPAADDRPWAGVLSFEGHSHMQRGKTEIAVGGGLAFVGPQTQLDEFQDWLHDLAGAPQPSAAVRANQIGNRFQPVVSAEIGRSLSLSQQASLRPFVEARAGDETYLRAGLDLTLGQLSTGSLLVRETVSGQRYSAVHGEGTGLTLTAGADFAYVGDSIYLPDRRGYELEKHRHRARLGLRWQGQNMAAFYGLSYLGKEFSSQSEGQLTGSLQLQLRF